MRIISKKRLRQFYTSHANAEPSLSEWIKKTGRASWKQFSEVKQTFNSADQLTLRVKRTIKNARGELVTQKVAEAFVIFNVGGNNFRVIASVNYRKGIVFIRDVLTHTEYSKEDWKNKL